MPLKVALRLPAPAHARDSPTTPLSWDPLAISLTLMPTHPHTHAILARAQVRPVQDRQGGQAPQDCAHFLRRHHRLWGGEQGAQDPPRFPGWREVNFVLLVV
jgi:hypothetical protein